MRSPVSLLSALIATLCVFISISIVMADQTTDAIPTALQNPWPRCWEEEFQARRQQVLEGMCAAQKAAGLGGSTYFENEKRAYGFLMAHLLAGDRVVAIKELQKEDSQAKQWYAHTAGIDYYACFTLKHQTRKYFLFGNLLDPSYKQRMFNGAKVWTEQDPLGRPHPAFVAPGDGWGPDARNSWVDVRTTENLFLMRVTSVYLMAEETGNEDTRERYKETILTYTAALYRVGMGEWDSENYHGHSLAPLLNPFDFARDEEVRAAAKACLDYLCAIGAVKYFRGAFNGPCSRDYNHPQPFGGSAPRMLWLYFGDTPLINTAFESDEVHVLTSGYRPPAAVVHLARKDFPRPAELFCSKPKYSATTRNDLESLPEYFETHYFGRTFQMGSLINGTPTGKTAVNGFKILIADKHRGAIAIQGVPGPDPRFVGSSLYQEGKVSGDNRVAQNGNLAVWLVRNGQSPWTWVVPDSVRLETEDGMTFLAGDQSWIAMRPIKSTPPKVDDELTKILTMNGRSAQWDGHKVLSARGLGGDFCGIAVEVGESPDFKDFAQFKSAVSSRSQVIADRLSGGEVEFIGATGRRVRIRFGNKPTETRVWRDGKPHDWSWHAQYLYHSSDERYPIIEQLWGSGKLTVQAGDSVFTAIVDENGRVTFRSQ
ncbi:MAG: hypothetical protein WBH86_07840 [Thermogutta sp.]